MRGPAGHLLRMLALAVAGVVMVVGGLALPAAAFVAIALVAGTVACLAGGAASDRSGERRRAAWEAAVVGAGGTLAAALLLAGLVVLLGEAVAVPFAGGAGAAALLVHLLRRRRRWRPAAATASPGPAARIAVVRPVRMLSTGALGREWLLSSAALGVLRDVAGRQAIVRRRQDLLDELERRDPAGFARWMAAGPLPGSDPADYLHGDAAAGRDAA